MKLRSLVLVAAGIGIGYSISRKMHEDDPEVVRGPQRKAAGSPGLQLVTGQAQRIAELERLVGRQALQLDMAKKVFGSSDFLLKGDE